MAVGSFKLPSNFVNSWKRPNDWLLLPELSETDERFVCLFAVFPEGLNVVTFSFTTSVGQYEVDWGDGMVQLFNSGVRAEHTYNYATITADVTTDGSKQCIISVVPLTGVFQQCNFQHLPSGQSSGFVSNFLDMEISMPNCISEFNRMVLGGATVYHTNVKRVRVRNCGNATHLNGLYLFMTSLELIYLFDTSLVTNMQQMHMDCWMLQTIPQYDTSNVTSTYSFAQSCYSLKKMPTLDYGNVLFASQMFFACKALSDANIGSMPSLILADNIFNQCYSLKKLPDFDSDSYVDMNSIALATSAPNIPLWDTSNCSGMANAFNSMRRLRTIPALDLGASTNNLGMASNCSALVWCDAININASISFSNCALSSDAIVNIFNNLVDRSATSSQNISVANNPGAALLTGPQIAIATAKNWTVTL